MDGARSSALNGARSSALSRGCSSALNGACSGAGRGAWSNAVRRECDKRWCAKEVQLLCVTGGGGIVKLAFTNIRLRRWGKDHPAEKNIRENLNRQFSLVSEYGSTEVLYFSSTEQLRLPRLTYTCTYGELYSTVQVCHGVVQWNCTRSMPNLGVQACGCNG